MGNKNPFAFFLDLKLEEKAPEPFVLSLVKLLILKLLQTASRGG